MPSNTELPKATSRNDPYRNFRFRLKWDGKYVAGVSKVSGLTRTTQVIIRRAGGDPTTSRRMPEQSEHELITLERGLTYEVAFEQWVNKVFDNHNFTIDDQQGGASNQDASLRDFRKDIVLEVYNESGQKVIAYTLYRCWPSAFSGTAETDGYGNALVIESLTLENEGWERDPSILEPDEPPSFTPPVG